MDVHFYLCPDGTRLRYAWFRVASESPRGTLLVLQGRLECLEIYGEQIAEWNARGFDVVSFDWRGQGGSSRPLGDTHKQHVQSFDVYRDDLRRFYTDIVAPAQRGPLVVSGHSLGGFVALDWLIQDKPEAKAAVLFAPMLAMPVPSMLCGALLTMSQTAIGLGFGESYGLFERRHEPTHWVFEGNALTHDPRRFRFIPDCFAAHPELALGGITYAWLHAALTALIRLRMQLHEVAPPVLVLNSGQDNVVLSHELSAWTHHMPRVTEKIYPTARHAVMMETDDVRQQAWHDIDAWLETVLASSQADNDAGLYIGLRKNA